MTEDENERRRELNDAVKDWTSEHRAPHGPDHAGLTVDDLRRLNDMVGEAVTVSEPGEFFEDVDGFPSGVGESSVTHETLASPVIGVAEFERLGVDPADFPNITVYDPANHHDQEDER